MSATLSRFDAWRTAEQEAEIAYTYWLLALEGSDVSHGDEPTCRAELADSRAHAHRCFVDAMAEFGSRRHMAGGKPLAQLMATRTRHELQMALARMST